MKKFLSFASLCTLFAVVTAVSCTKEFDEAVPVSDGEEREVIFDVAQLATRTTIAEDGDKLTISWANTDNSSVHLFENGKEGTKETISVGWNGKYTISANFSGLGLSLLGGFTYNGVIAKNFANGVASVPALQNPVEGSFDPAADVLIAGAYYAGKARPVLTGLKLNFVRVNAVTRLEVTGLAAGEKVDFIDIVAENPIAGPLNPLKGTEFDGYNTANGSKSIRLEFDGKAAADENGTFVTYFTSWITEFGAFTVKVLTAGNEYNQTVPAGTYTFNNDEIQTVSLAMEGQGAKTKRYELVTAVPEDGDWSGTYLIVGVTAEGAAKVINPNSKSTGYTSDITVQSVNGVSFVNSSTSIDKYAFDISDSNKGTQEQTLWNVVTGRYYMFGASSITFSTSNSTGKNPDKVYYYHTFAYDSGVQMTCEYGENKSYLELGQDGKFTYSANDGARVYLYKYIDTGRKSQTISFGEDVVNWTIAEGKYEIGGTYPAQAFARRSDYQQALLTYSSSDPSVASIDNEGNITIHKQGDVTIQAYVANNTEYRSAVASYDLIISVPYYQRITSEAEIVNGGKYIIVSKSAILGSNWYHAFNAAKAGTYNYDITTLENLVFGNPVYDNGERIRPSAAIDANQVVIDGGLLSSIAKILGLSGTYTIKPVNANGYLYCNMETTQILDFQVPIPTYSIAFSNDETDGTSMLSLATKYATMPHAITFNEDGTANIKCSLSKLAIGADLFYDKLTKRYEYVNLSLFEGFESLTDLIQYYSQDSEYAWIINLVKLVGDAVSIPDLIKYFSADLYVYRYIG